MKRILALAVPAALLTMIAATDASAEPTVNPIMVNPAFRFFQSTVRGTIKVPGAQTGALSGFGCANISVTAVSTQTVTPAGGGFPYPKWTRTGYATGNYASGQCSYSIAVPPGSPFVLQTAGHGSFHCDVIYANPGSGNQAGPTTVPFTFGGSSVTDNLSIAQLVCENIT